MYKSRNKIVSNFVEKLLKYRIMFRYILTFLGINYRDALLIKLYYVHTYLRKALLLKRISRLSQTAAINLMKILADGNSLVIEQLSY